MIKLVLNSMNEPNPILNIFFNSNKNTDDQPIDFSDSA
jgi:hypothetical protein